MVKVMTIVGTRPELIKMSAVIACVDQVAEHVLVHTGQNFDPNLSDVFFEELGIRAPDHYLGVAASTAAEAIANVIQRVDKVLELEKPDAVLVYGDTNSGLAVISAKRRKIPIFHMEAGNRCFDQRVPEELNRKVIDHLSDINMVLSEQARSNLLAEGIASNTIFNVGSHMKEVLERNRHKIAESTVLETLGLKSEQYFLVSMHREENVDQDDKLRVLVASLEELSAKYGYPIIVSTHPRTRKRLETLGVAAESKAVRFLGPFPFFSYIKLQQQAFCVISDSGTIFEESALLDLPAITIRDAHERPEGVDAGTLIIADMSISGILNAVDAVRKTRLGSRFAGPIGDYDVEVVSSKVARIVLSYIGFVNRVVWRKPEA